MTANDFRRLALGFPEVEERAHMHHPDFRVQGRIFATLNYPGKGWGMVRLPPEEQSAFVHAHPQAFVPVKGAWGRQGCTSVRLEAAEAGWLKRALAVAWHAAVGQKKWTRPARTKPSANRN
jgi:hypothetical protein